MSGVGRGRGRARAGDARQTAQSPGAGAAAAATAEQAESGRRAATGRRGAEAAPPPKTTPPKEGKAQRGSPPDQGSPGAEGERWANVNLISLMPRPGFGQLGRKYRMFANHFELGFSSKALTINQYHVTVAHPKVKIPRDDNRPIFWKCLNQYRQELGLGAPDALYSVIYDGATLLFSLDTLNIPMEANNNSRKFEVEHTASKFDKVETFEVTIQYTGPLLVDFSQVLAPNLKERVLTPIQVIDIMLRQYRSHPFLESHKLFYPFRNTVYMIPGTGSAPGGFDLGGGREVWKGLFTSAHAVDRSRAYVNMDVDHTAFHKFTSNGRQENGNGHYTVIQFLCDVLNETERQPRYFPNELTPDTVLPEPMKRIFQREIKGLKVCIDYKRPNVTNDLREYRVLDVDKSAIDCTFTDKKTERLTNVAEYYQENYGALKLPRLFTLKVGTKKRSINLPAEHCYLARNQKVKHKLTEKQTAAMIKQTCMAPANRKQSIEQVVRLARFHEDPFLNKFGVRINPQMVDIEARRLPEPALQYADRTVNTRDGVWNTKGQRFCMPASCESLAVIGFTRVPPNANQFVEELIGMCRDLGMKMPALNSIFFHIEKDSSAQRSEIAIKKVLSNLKTVHLIIAILPFKGGQLYAEVKRAAEIQMGVMTQCVVGKTIDRYSPDTLTNIAMKINMKLGGINCALTAREQALKLLTDPKSPTFVMGIDVTHPGPTEKKKPSVASVVGSLDFNQMRYAASIKVQKTTKEQVVYMSNEVTERLLAFYKATQRKPERVIVYRDGVSEGQFDTVIREELRNVREGCLKLDPNFRPKITFVVVQKRHHTRFFPADPNDGCGKHKNVYPGTVVDNVIVNPDEFVFYLCAHAGIQGTSRPSRYYVLHDENNFSADDLQMITYYLCHCFSRCTRAVSIPAPVYFADLACTRARAHLLATLGDTLSDTTSTISAEAEEGGSSSSPKEEELIAATRVTDNIRREMYFT